MSEQLLSDANIFAQHIVIAVDCLDQTRAMDKIFSSPEHSIQYKVAPYFYRTAFHAMRFRLEIEVAKLLDQHGKSFDSFKNHLSRNGLIAAADLEKYNECLHKAQRDLRSIKNRRNKIHAHSDADYFNAPDIFSEEHPVNWNCVRELLLIMLHICNGVILRLTQEGIAPLRGIGNSDDFVRLFGYETAFEKLCNNI